MSGGIKNAFTAERIRLICELYPTHTCVEVAAIVGCDGTAVWKRAKRHGVSHTPEFLAEISRRRSNASHTRTPETIEKMRRTRRATVRAERLRKLSGEPQRTRIALSDVSVRVERCLRRLCAKNGYRLASDDYRTIVVMPGTRRTSREKYLSDRYRFKFIELNEFNKHEHGTETGGAGNILRRYRIGQALSHIQQGDGDTGLQRDGEAHSCERGQL